MRTRPFLEEDLVAGEVGRRAPDWDLIQILLTSLIQQLSSLLRLGCQHDDLTKQQSDNTDRKMMWKKTRRLKSFLINEINLTHSVNRAKKVIHIHWCHVQCIWNVSKLKNTWEMGALKWYGVYCNCRDQGLNQVGAEALQKLNYFLQRFWGTKIYAFLYPN